MVSSSRNVGSPSNVQTQHSLPSQNNPAAMPNLPQQRSTIAPPSLSARSPNLSPTQLFNKYKATPEAPLGRNDKGAPVQRKAVNYGAPLAARKGPEMDSKTRAEHDKLTSDPREKAAAEAAKAKLGSNSDFQKQMDAWQNKQKGATSSASSTSTASKSTQSSNTKSSFLTRFSSSSSTSLGFSSAMSRIKNSSSNPLNYFSAEAKDKRAEKRWNQFQASQNPSQTKWEDKQGNSVF